MELYADTGLIISKLCKLAGIPNERETEALGNAMFGFGAMLIPYKLIADEAFLKDRAELTGRPWSQKSIVGQRPFALSQFLAYLDVIDGLLVNGGGFIKHGRLSLADLHLSFVVSWVLFGHKGADPEVNPKTHPRIYQWLSSIQSSIKSPKPPKVTFEEAKKSLLAPGMDHQAQSDPHEPLKLQPGSMVSVLPLDTGRSHPQMGKLIHINTAEVCLQTTQGVFITFPRVGYSVSQSKRQPGKL